MQKSTWKTVDLVGNEYSYDPYRVTHYAYDVVGAEIVWHGTYQAGDRVKTENGTPVTIVGFAGPIALVKYDWDGPQVSPREVDANSLRPMEVEPEGEPLPRVEVVELDQTEAEDAARETWQDIAPEDKGDLLDAEDEPSD